MRLITRINDCYMTDNNGFELIKSPSAFERTDVKRRCYGGVNKTHNRFTIKNILKIIKSVPNFNEKKLRFIWNLEIYSNFCSLHDLIVKKHFLNFHNLLY